MDKFKEYLKSFPDRFKLYIKNYWWKFLIVFVVILADMLTKFLLVPEDKSIWNEIVLIPEILTFTPAQNTGAGFSLLEGKQWLLIIITVVFLIFMTIFDISFQKKSKLFGVATALIVSGALGNLIDRVCFNYVRDFIYLKFINFPVFNIADMAITFGIVILMIYIIFYSTKPEKNVKKTENELPNEEQNLKNEE